MELLDECETLATDLGDAGSLSLASVALGTALLWQGELDPAENLLERCLDQLNDALEASPAPSTEWSRLLRTLDRETVSGEFETTRSNNVSSRVGAGRRCARYRRTRHAPRSTAARRWRS